MIQANLIQGTVQVDDLKDKEIVALVKAGQKTFYSELVKRHQKSVLRVIVRMVRDTSLAEDVVQEAFLKGFTKIHLFRGDAAFKSWVTKIAVNTAKNQLRKRRRECVDIDELSLGVDDRMDAHILQGTLKNQIKALIDTLPEKQKRALALRVYSGLSFKEIAFLMKCPYDTAKANYRHALLKLRTKIVSDETFTGWEEISA